MPNYFDNKIVTGLIVEYLKYPQEQRIQKKQPLFLRQQILKEVGKIVNGIIFTHKFCQWETYDDLYQEAALACLKALDKFNPNYITAEGKKATAFNYFSLTAKRCLKFYTIRNKKNRSNDFLDDHNDLSVEEEFYGSINELTLSGIVGVLRMVFENRKYKKFVRLIDIFEEYIHKMGFFNKRDFFRFSKSFGGFSPNLIRKFLKIIKENKEVFQKNGIING